MIQLLPLLGDPIGCLILTGRSNSLVHCTYKLIAGSRLREPKTILGSIGLDFPEGPSRALEQENLRGRNRMRGVKRQSG